MLVVCGPASCLSCFNYSNALLFHFAADQNSPEVHRRHPPSDVDEKASSDFCPIFENPLLSRPTSFFNLTSNHTSFLHTNYNPLFFFFFFFPYTRIFSF
nr:hypothetical protein Iba_chr05bCG3630 [Ipomoea batatas]